MALTIGVDLGGTKLLGIALDGERVVAEQRRPTPRGGDAVVASVVELVSALAVTVGGVEAVGFGAPGLVDRTGVLRFGPNLPDVVDLPFAAVLAEQLGLPVVVDNDATCATWGEHTLGAGRSVADLVLVTLGTGIGAGIVADGCLHRGRNGFAGEAGHMVVDPDGPPCPCGRRGCWERYASGSGFGRMARDAATAGRARRITELAGGDPEAVRGEHVTTAANEGDEEATTLFAQFGWWVALGIANLVNLLDPELVLIGGGLVEAGEHLLRPTRAAYDELVLGVAHRPGVRIERAQLGERAGAIGAAALAARGSSNPSGPRSGQQ